MLEKKKNNTDRINKTLYSQKCHISVSTEKWEKCICGAWWRHQIETFSALQALCVGNSPVTDEFPTQRSVRQSLDVFFDLCLSKRLSKQLWGWWFETPSGSLWRHCNGVSVVGLEIIVKALGTLIMLTSVKNIVWHTIFTYKDKCVILIINNCQQGWIRKYRANWIIHIP